MIRFKTAALVLLLVASAGLFSAKAEKPAGDLAALAAENAALRFKVGALVAVQGQCLEAVEQFRNARSGKPD
jgi:hypothetical protein